MDRLLNRVEHWATYPIWLSMKVATVSRVSCSCLTFLFVALGMWWLMSLATQVWIGLSFLYTVINHVWMSKQLKNKLDVSTKAAQLNLIDPTPLQEPSLQSMINTRRSSATNFD